MMDFSLTESQQAVAGLAAQVLGGPDPWKHLAQAGLLNLGDEGLGLPEVTVMLTEIGRHAAPDSLKALATLMTGAVRSDMSSPARRARHGRDLSPARVFLADR